MRGSASCSSPAAAADRHPELVAAAADAGARISPVTERAAASLSDTVTPQGLVAVCDLLDVPRRRRARGAPVAGRRLRRHRRPGQRRHRDPGGRRRRAPTRCCSPGDTVDPHNGKAVRASTGSVFHLPLARDRDAAAVLDACAAAGLTLLAADAARRARPARPGRRRTAGRAGGLGVRRRGARRARRRRGAGRPPRPGPDPRPRREPQPGHRRRGLPLRQCRSTSPTRIRRLTMTPERTATESTDLQSLLDPDALKAAVAAAERAFAEASDLAALAAVRPAHLGDRAPLLLARRELGSLPGPDRAEAGKRVNAARQEAQEAFDARRAVLVERARRAGARRGGRRRHAALGPRSRAAPGTRSRRSPSASPTCSSRWAGRSPRAPRSRRPGSTSTR